MLTVAEFDNWDQLAKIRLLWQDLWLKTENRTFFQTYHWFESFCRDNPEIEKFRVLVVNLEGKPAGLVPFVVRVKRKGLLKYRTLTYPLDSQGMHFGPLGAYPSTTTATVIKHLQESQHDWNSIELHHVDVDGSDKNRMMNAMTSRGMKPSRALNQLCGKVSMARDWGEYWYRLPQEVRQRFDEAEKMVSTKGILTYNRFSAHRSSNQDEVAHGEITKALSNMKRVSFVKSKLRKNQSCRDNEKNMLSSLHELAFRHGIADTHVLFLNEKPYAGVYNYCSFGRVDCQAFFLAPEAIPESLDLLIAEMLRSCFAMGDRELYFPAEFYRHTLGWQNEVGTSYRHTHFSSNSIRAQLKRLVEWMMKEESDVEKQYRSYRNTREPNVMAKPQSSPQKFSVVG